jgi:aminoglycoside phosphotransferase (APT) family kinase protein
MAFDRPTPEQIRVALGQCAPDSAREPIHFLGEGWSVWTFRVGDHVLRFPKSGRDLGELKKEREFLPLLAEHIATQIPSPDTYCDTGPNGLPFIGYPMLPGRSLIRADILLPASVRTGRSEIPLADSFGRDLGAFLRQLHSYPAELALRQGIALVDGAALRADRERDYDEAMETVFPLISADAVALLRARFAAYLDDSANFDFDPCLIHGDLDRQNVLVEGETGELSGVIDFGGLRISKPATDFLLPLGDFPSLSISHQLPSLLEAYGEELDLERARIEVDFTQQVLWPIYDVEFGKYWGNDEFVARGVEALERLTGAG